MKWPFFSKKTTPDSDRLERYKQFREIGRKLNLILVKQLPQAAVPEYGKKLGVYKAGTLILNNEDEIAILYDYCLHHYRRAGKNVVERYLETSPPAPDSAEMRLLQAMSKSWCSVFRVEEITPHEGALLRDLLTDSTLDLVDTSLSQTGSPGLILVGRVLPLADFHISSGTLIPLPEPVFVDKIKPILDKFLHGRTPTAHPLFAPAQEAAFVAQLIRIALQAGGEDNVFYTDIEG